MFKINITHKDRSHLLTIESLSTYLKVGDKVCLRVNTEEFCDIDREALEFYNNVENSTSSEFVIDLSDEELTTYIEEIIYYNKSINGAAQNHIFKVLSIGCSVVTWKGVSCKYYYAKIEELHSGNNLTGHIINMFIPYLKKIE